ESDPHDLPRILSEQAAAARAVVAQFRSLLEGWQAGQPLPAALRLTGHNVHRYDGPGFEGLDPGSVGDWAALVRTDELVFTDAILAEALGDRRPAYLGGAASPAPGAPSLSVLDLGYRREVASPTGYHDGFYAATLRLQLDVQAASPATACGLVVA